MPQFLSAISFFGSPETKMLELFYVAGYDVQSENKDKLGMAIIMPTAQVAGTAATPNANTDIQNTYIMKANITANEPVTFRFYTCWEKSDNQFTSLDGFKKFIENEVNKSPFLNML